MIDFLWLGIGILFGAAFAYTMPRRQLRKQQEHIEARDKQSKQREDAANRANKDGWAAAKKAKQEAVWACNRYNTARNKVRDEFEAEYKRKCDLAEEARILSVLKAAELQQRITNYDNTTSSSSEATNALR